MAAFYSPPLESFTCNEVKKKKVSRVFFFNFVISCSFLSLCNNISQCQALINSMNYSRTGAVRRLPVCFDWYSITSHVNTNDCNVLMLWSYLWNKFPAGRAGLGAVTEIGMKCAPALGNVLTKRTGTEKSLSCVLRASCWCCQGKNPAWIQLFSFPLLLTEGLCIPLILPVLFY